jgi:PiT family inorganic phosphate transporter
MITLVVRAGASYRGFMHLLAQLSAPDAAFLALAVGLALLFEFVNGFHDTANAVATVIYTNSMPPWLAVVWSGLWNLIGVLVSTVIFNGGVAFTIVALLPGDVVANIGSAAGFAMIFSLLISAILWNLGTWYLGLPASSSHTLIGAILGVGLAHTVSIAGAKFGQGVDWTDAGMAFLALLISPVIGFVFAGGLLWISKRLIPDPVLYTAPLQNRPPPLWIRSLLVLTCTGVSAAHGSNDGQKGMGLMLLILIALWPAKYAINMDLAQSQFQELQTTARLIQPDLKSRASAQPMSDDIAAAAVDSFIHGQISPSTKDTFAALAVLNKRIAAVLDSHQSLADLSTADRRLIRTDFYLANGAITRLIKQNQFTDPAERQQFAAYAKNMDATIRFIPLWIIFATAFALGLGTMIGWRRVVQTVGEKIGRQRLSYAQGASAGLVAMVTIGLASAIRLPVSTTHVVSSGVAGTMTANNGGLQTRTVRNLILAWVLTVPVCVILGAGFFSAALYFVIDVLHRH